MSRDFLGLPVKDFLAEVATPEPMPGAGYCAAMTLSMAAGLVAMVAGASRAEWGEARGAAAQANTLRERVAPLAQLNVDAYASAIRRLRAAEFEPDEAVAETPPAAGDDLGILLERAAQIPIDIAQAAVDVASLAAVVAERGKQAMRADAVAGALLAQGAARAAATLVEVNLGTTSTDARVTRVRDLAGSANAAAERALATLA